MLRRIKMVNKKEEKLKKIQKHKNAKKKAEAKKEKSKVKDSKQKKDKPKKIENPNAVIKKHHVWGLAGVIVGILIALLIITLFSVKYVTHQKSVSYVEGGRDALREVFNSVNNQGGLILNFEGESIIIAKYNKETSSVETTEEDSTA